MSNVISLLPSNALATDAKQIADRVADIAESIRAGEWKGLERVIVIFEDAGAMDYRCFGRTTTNAEFVGLLQFAQRKVMG